MKLAKTMVMGIGGMGLAYGALAAGPPPLDRPTPPPCCADGLCYPNPTTYGWYQRRWRRWPTDVLEPTPAELPGRVTPDIPAFDLPPKEEEDRSAPPPTRPAEQEAEAGEEEPGAEVPPTMPLAPPPRSGMPPGSPFEDDTPATEPTDTFPFGEPVLPRAADPGMPMGDADPPPSPPFGNPSPKTPTVAEGPALRAAERIKTVPAQRTNSPPRRAPSDDPPPALPLALALAGANH